MRKTLLCHLLAGLCCLTVSGSLLPARADAPAYRSDRIIIRPKADSVEKLAKLHTTLGSKIHRAYARFGGMQVLTLPKGAKPEAWVEKYRGSGLVDYAVLDGMYYLDASTNDPFLRDGSLWGMVNQGQDGGTKDADIDATEAWNVINQAPNVVVAVIDTGINYNHEDLKANLWKNPGEIAGNNRDDDRNGYVDDVYGIDSRNGSGDPLDDNGHGSHCAGTIGGVGNNNKGVVGVAWKVKIMACRFLGGSLGSGSDSDAIECIAYAISQGAHVMSNSWGGSGFNQALEDAIDAARQANIVFVAAAGNGNLLGVPQNNDKKPHYPSSYDVNNIVSVAATDRDDKIASFSNFGAKTVDLAAPGVDIISCWKGAANNYDIISGTSMATPAVSGAFALLKARHPNASYAELIIRALRTVDQIPSMNGKCLTDGRLNVATAVSRKNISFFTYAQNSGRRFHFASRSLGPLTSLLWEFGDGTSSNAASLSKDFNARGTYHVKLTVFGTSNTDVFTQKVVVD